MPRMLAYEHLLGNKQCLDRKVTDYEDLRHPLNLTTYLMEVKGATDWGFFHESNLEQACIEIGLPTRDSGVGVVWPEGF
jgi:hypothetical protein